jgi:uncharacterized protein (UPF0371 family)
VNTPFFFDILKGMNTKDTIDYKRLGFNQETYTDFQSKSIIERISKFPEGRLYLEIGGKLISDPHAARVLPGFQHDSKISILKNLGIKYDILFCIDYGDLVDNRQLHNKSEDYIKASYKIIKDIERDFKILPKVVINKIEDDTNPLLQDSINLLESNGIQCYKRYHIDGYPDKTEYVLSSEGYGRDDYIELDTQLVIVTGAASNSGKMSTCLGQMYIDKTKYNVNSGFAKFETFPVWNLDIKHPINLAYEAATADIGDRNVIDILHLEAYGKSTVNYNRDIQSFKIIKMLTDNFLDESNHVCTYKSPTDMGINMVGYAIENDEIVSIASYQEIERRKNWYQELVDQGLGKSTWVKICEELKEEALDYIEKNNYNTNLKLQ